MSFKLKMKIWQLTYTEGWRGKEHRPQKDNAVLRPERSSAELFCFWPLRQNDHLHVYAFAAAKLPRVRPNPARTHCDTDEPQRNAARQKPTVYDIREAGNDY